MGTLINLGSLCVDNVYRVPHLTGTGETVASVSHHIFPGGKGLNQSLAASRAGARVRHVGCVGSDGDMLISVLADAGVDVAGIRRLVDVASGHAVIQVDDGGANAIVIAGGANRCVTEADVTRALDGASENDWLLLQNEINDLEIVLARAATLDVRVAVNVAPTDGREAGYDLSGVDLLIVNETEAAALAGDVALPPDTALERLASRWPNSTLVLTLGRAGLIYQLPGHAPQRLAAFPVRAVDETAAGDAFIGYLLAGLLAGDPLEQALRCGCAAGALAVTREGAATAIPREDEVRALLTGSPGR